MECCAGEKKCTTLPQLPVTFIFYFQHNMNANAYLILASRSPRRRQLLSNAGAVFEVIPASDHAEDAIRPSESPTEYVQRLALQKAGDVAGRLRSGQIALRNDFSADDSASDKKMQKVIVLGCDTLAVCRGRILGKPNDAGDARRMLTLLQGNEHETLSGLCLIEWMTGRTLVDIARSTLFMHIIGEEILEKYLASGQWEGKAGAFGYQDGLPWLEITGGSESNVVGLPLELLDQLLDRMLVDDFSDAVPDISSGGGKKCTTLPQHKPFTTA